MFFLGRPEYREPTYRLPEMLPYWGFIAPGVLAQKDPLLQTTYAYRPHDLTSANRTDLVQACANYNNAVQRLGTGWSLFFETQRREAEPPPPAGFTEAAPFLVDCERRRGRERRGPQFESFHYLTAVNRMPSELVDATKGFFYKKVGGKEQPNAAVERHIAAFLRTCEGFTDQLRGGTYAEVRGLSDPDTLTYIHSTLSTNRHPVVPPQGGYFIDSLLADMPFQAADTPMLGDSFMPVAVVSHFPPNTHPAILAGLDALGFEYRLVVRFECLDSADAEKDLNAARRVNWAGRKSLFKLFKEEATKEESQLLDNGAASRAADADAALQSLGEGLVSFGRTTITVVTWDKDLAVARQKMREIKQVFQANGCVVRDEGLNSTAAWLGSLPGHVYANVRRPILSSLNLAHFVPISGRWSGSAYNKHLEGITGVAQSLLHCTDDSGGPLRFNPTVSGDDNGHMINAGPTGAGKSVLLANKAYGFKKYPGSRVIIFDKDRSARAATMAIGGRIFEPGNPQAPCAFQPLARIDQPDELLWAHGFILRRLEFQLNSPSNPERQATVDRALRALAGRARAQRTLFNLGDAFGDPELSAALRPYTVQGPFGQIFDGDEEALGGGFGSWTMVELGHLLALGQAVVAPAMEILFHLVSKSLDGTPTLFQVDEAHRLFTDQKSVEDLILLLREARKNALYCDYYSTSLSDFANCPAAPILIESCPTKVFLPNSEALHPNIKPIYTGFGLDDAKIARIAGARRKSEYFMINDEGCSLFNLDLGPIAMAFTTMTGKQDQIVLDRIVATTPPEEYGEAILRHRNLPWAADLMAEARRRQGPLFS
jgi:type IV secretory pathway VirB4 component